ncbi:kinase-like domain-containing protein [Cokeromyces recurvatus]|uniref:kinase-like domain-containing protein n=1 Tax=Cokeromyces recurvatus TaxID=90255 RepID=UPI00221F322B|nr:kinase-like domain-containing protein [Cokeromyces recurvatus]KAI7906368.1 kinase-like domain-containing protein [Cokeromyces recurvatus]
MSNISAVQLPDSSQTSMFGDSNCSTSNSNNGTVFYSPENEKQNMLKRHERSDGSDDPDSNELTRKLSKIGHTDDSEESSTTSLRKTVKTNSNNNDEDITAAIDHVSSKSEPQSSKQSSISFKLEEPNWSAHKTAWAFLQSLNPKYKSKYLERREHTQGRPGYLLGRRSDSDIRFDQIEISKRHCLIYMETGANGRAKGIRIFLEDLSFNGTFVNGELVGVKKRVLLRNGDEIQLYKRNAYAEDDLRQKFFRILFPSQYEANTCEHEYKIGRLLGRGNFAGVYHAVHRQTNHVVAVKVINKSRFANKPKLTQSLIQEVGIMMAIEKHPFVVRINKIFNEVQRIFLVLEYVPGGELFHYIRNKIQLEENETRFIFWQLLIATKYLHENNIAHRDLKPENILIVDQKTLHVKITDFGLAKTEQRNQYFDSQCGTANYVAPEVLVSSEDRAYDKQCDSWSLGVILFVCLGGYPPFSEKDKILNGDFNFNTPQWDLITDDAKDLIQEHLTVNPALRITVTDALEHSWMKMNHEVMTMMRNRLGEDVLNAVKELNITDNSSSTQLALTQSISQSLR